jgi:hypothetical protein
LKIANDLPWGYFEDGSDFLRSEVFRFLHDLIMELRTIGIVVEPISLMAASMLGLIIDTGSPELYKPVLGCVGRAGPAESLAGVGGMWMFLRYEVEKPVGGFLLAGESDGGENGCAEPGVPCLAEGRAQNLESFGRVGLGNSHGGFGCGTVFW